MKLIQQVLSHENLSAAWDEVAAKKGAAGVDRVSIKRWRRRWEENLQNLALAVMTNTYQPSPSRTVCIPKKKGGWRRISILTVTDRVLQRAVLRVVDDCFDHGFLDCSYGFRQGRGVRDAVSRIIELRDQGYQWVLDADIDDCFNNLDHMLIRHFFRQTVADPILNRLVRQWLRVGASSEEDHRGIEMGGVISPLFCNLVLHQVDRVLSVSGWKMVRYADDFCVFAGSETEVCRAYDIVGEVLAALHLEYEPHKTRITDFDHGFDFLGGTFIRDEYHFTSNKKRVAIEGDLDNDLFIDYHPEGYW